MANPNIQQKNIAEKAWKYRESGNAIKSISLLQTLIYKSSAKENWAYIINLLFYYSISWKILAKQNNEDKDFYNTAIQSLYFAKQIAEKHNIELRKDFSEYLAEILTSSGKYKKAIQQYENYLKINTEISDEKKYNTQAHIGYCEYKLGNSNGAVKIKKAIQGLEKSRDKNTHLDKSVTLIWLTGALMKYAEVLDNKDEAKKVLTKALKIAKENNLGAREKQVNLLLK